MFTNTEVISKEAVAQGIVPALQGKFVELEFRHARVRGIVEVQDGTRIKLAESDAIESNVCSGLNLNWDSFVGGVARS